MLTCVGFRTVLVCILLRCVERCECWTCAWLLSLIVIVLILLCTPEPPRTVFTVGNKHISVHGEALSLFTIIPADAKMLQTYLIYCINIGSFFFFFLSLNLYIYSSVCLLCIFRLPSCRDPHRDGSPRIVLSPTCLGISDWRCDCVIMTQPLWPLCRPQQLFTDPTCYALSLSSLSVSLSLHGVDMAFWMLATNILSLWVICTLFFLVCHLVKDVSWFSTEIYWHSIFIGCKSRLKVIVFNCSIVLLWVCAWVSRWFWRSEAGEFSVSQDFVLKEHSNNFTR